MDEIVTSRFSDELLKKMDQMVARGYFRSRSEAIRVIVEEYFREGAPRLSEGGLEYLGACLFEGVGVARLVSEG